MNILNKKSITCVLMLFVSVFMMAGSAEAKQLKVTSFPKTMQVGQRKTIKANQVVKWSSLNKNIIIETKKNAKKVTICAKKKGTGTLVAQKGANKIKIKIQVKEKTVSQNNTEQKEVSWEDAMKNGGEVYIIAISGNTVEFATKKGGSLSKYLILNDTIDIMKNGKVVSKDCLKVGQCVKIDYKYHEDIVGGRLCECKSITIIE